MNRTPTSSTADSSTFRVLAWLGVALQAAALVGVVLLQRWNGLPSIAIFLVLSVTFLLIEDGVPSLVSFLVVLAAIVNAGGWGWEWYALVWFDEFVHFFTSVAVVAAVLCMAWPRRVLPHPSSLGHIVLMGAAVGLGLGILWEIAEALFVSLTVVDTVFDLILDTLGAAVGGWLADWAAREHRQPAQYRA